MTASQINPRSWSLVLAPGPREQLEVVLEAYALRQHQGHDQGTELAAPLHQGEHVERAREHLHAFIAGLIAAAATAGEVRDDTDPGELASYCLHALTAAGSLPSQAAARRLVTVTLDGLRPAPAHHDATTADLQGLSSRTGRAVYALIGLARTYGNGPVEPATLDQNGSISLTQASDCRTAGQPLRTTADNHTTGPADSGPANPSDYLASGRRCRLFKSSHPDQVRGHRFHSEAVAFPM